MFWSQSGIPSHTRFPSIQIFELKPHRNRCDLSNGYLNVETEIWKIVKEQITPTSIDNNPSRARLQPQHNALVHHPPILVNSIHSDRLLGSYTEIAVFQNI